MLQDIGSRVNWVDLVCLILVIRATYIGFRTGLSTEIFKFLGIVSALIVSIRGYSFIAGFISGFLPQPTAEVVSFCVILVALILLFSIIRRLFGFLFKLQPINWLERGGGLILGLARGVIFTSLVLMILTLTQSGYLNSSIKDESFSGAYFLKIAPKIYILSGRIIPNFNTESEVTESEVLNQ